ncbi:hypothetical protein [Photobacterium sagamiensis]
MDNYTLALNHCQILQDTFEMAGVLMGEMLVMFLLISWICDK